MLTIWSAAQPVDRKAWCLQNLVDIAACTAPQIGYYRAPDGGVDYFSYVNFSGPAMILGGGFCYPAGDWGH
jgi:hypothetical protein